MKRFPKEPECWRCEDAHGWIRYKAAQPGGLAVRLEWVECPVCKGGEIIPERRAA